MKSIILVVGLLLNLNLYSQTEKVYFDKNWKITNIINEIEYFRIFEKKNNIYENKDYYLTGELQSIFNTSTNILKDNVDINVDGISKYYYKEGQVMLTSQYKNNKKNGESIFYYKNGNVKRIVNYIDGKPIGEVLNYNPFGQLVSLSVPDEDILINFYKGLRNVNYKNDKILHFNDKIPNKYINYNDKFLSSEFTDKYLFNNGNLRSDGVYYAIIKDYGKREDYGNLVKSQVIPFDEYCIVFYKPINSDKLYLFRSIEGDFYNNKNQTYAVKYDVINNNAELQIEKEILNSLNENNKWKNEKVFKILESNVFRFSNDCVTADWSPSTYIDEFTISNDYKSIIYKGIESKEHSVNSVNKICFLPIYNLSDNYLSGQVFKQKEINEVSLLKEKQDQIAKVKAEKEWKIQQEKNRLASIEFEKNRILKLKSSSVGDRICYSQDWTHTESSSGFFGFGSYENKINYKMMIVCYIEKKEGEKFQVRVANIESTNKNEYSTPDYKGVKMREETIHWINPYTDKDWLICE